VALVVNELISNCYEHAFTNVTIGEITIEIIYDEDD
jgi:two-component sensor histidine kinase